jgi:hypothetical protein
MNREQRRRAHKGGRCKRCDCRLERRADYCLQCAKIIRHRMEVWRRLVVDPMKPDAQQSEGRAMG